VIPADSPVVAQIKEILTKLANTSFPGQGIATPGMHLPLSDPAKHPKDSQDPNYQGMMLLNCSAKQNNPPQVVKRVNGQYIAINPDTERALIYSGMESYVSVGFFTYFTSGTSFGIGCALNLVLVTGHDVGRFDGRATAESAFAGLPQGADFSAAPPPPPPATPAPQQAPNPGGPADPGVGDGGVPW
jgi:hypothetical protein